jgi:hypothetical protein
MAAIDGPPPVFDPIKREARYLNKNGDMTVVTFDSRNVAKVSLVRSWMNTANYGPVNGFSRADNNYFVSFYDPTKDTAADGIVSATLVNAPVAISTAGIYNVVQKSSRGRNGNVYMRTDGNIAYVPNVGSGYTNGAAAVFVNGKTVNITIIVGGSDSGYVNFFLSIPVGQQPKPDGSSPSEIIKCARVPTPGIAAISQRDAVAMTTAFNKAFPDGTQTDYRKAVPGVFAVTPYGVGGLHVTGTGVPAGDMLYFATQINVDPETGQANPRYNSRYTPLITYNGNILVLAVDNMIMWVSTTNVKYAFINNNYESTQTRGFVTSVCIAANAIYYTTENGVDDGLFRFGIYTRLTEQVKFGYSLRVIGVVPAKDVTKGTNEIVTQIYIARLTTPSRQYYVDLTNYVISDFTVLTQSYPSDGYPTDGQCYQSLSWPLCYTGGNVAPCSTAAGDDAKKCCLTDSGAACPPAWTALPSDDYCTDFFGGRRNKCMRDR